MRWESQLAARTERGQNKSVAEKGEGGDPGSEVPGMPPSVELVQQGADTPFMRQVERHVPTMADAPQGSLIVILKDSTKSTWQFTRTEEAGLRVRGTHTHTPGRAHTCWEAPWARMHTLIHAHK